MANLIAVGNFRGGIGKTTTTVNLAHACAEMGMRTLIIDADPQNNATPFFAKAKENGKTIAEAVKNPLNIKKYIEKSRYKNLDILKGNTSLMGEELDKDELGWLAKAKDYINAEYDICFIDTNPDLSSMTASVLVAADMLLTPVGLNASCRDNLALLQNKVESLVENGMVWKVFAMKVDLHRIAQKKCLEDIVNKHTYPFLDHYVSCSADIDNAWGLYKPVAKHRSKSIVVEEFRALAQEVLDVLESGVE